MCFNECMPFTKYYFLDSNNDDEVSFILELISILQIDFSQKVTLVIKSQRKLDHLVNEFNWLSVPEMSTREIASTECLLDLFKENNAHRSDGGAILVSSTSNISGKNVFKISSHLLTSAIKHEEVTTSLAWSVANAIIKRDFYQEEPRKIITIVSSDEVNDWISLIEATVSIMAYWYRYQTSDTILNLLDLSKGIQKSETNKISMNSECMIIVKISKTTSQFIKLTRTLNPACKMVFHGFESASVYYANTFLYDVDSCLYEEDLWIMSCQADAELAKLAWKKIKTKVVPLKKIEFHKKSLKTDTEKKHLYFFGRISEQKNIEASIFAVALIADEMRKSRRKFKIFGYEDYLGVPNLRVPGQGYLEELYGIVKRLGLTDLVEFYPAVHVQKMEEELRQGIFLSPSVHSDENFGLVAFRALRLGAPVILSKWGGHKDLAHHFSGIEYVDVYETKTGPEINPCQIAHAALQIWKKNSIISELKYNQEMISLEWSESHPLEPSHLKAGIINRIKDSFPWGMRKWPLYGKIFQNHQDPNYLAAQRIYGAVNLPSMPKIDMIVSPLVRILPNEIKVKDARLGVLRYSRKGEQKIKLKQLGTDNFFHLSLQESKWLWENGYIFLKGVP